MSLIELAITPNLAIPSFPIYNDTMSQALHLYRLQLLDTKNDQITTRLEAIRRLLQDDAALQNAQMAKSQSTQDLQKARRNLAQAEEAVRSQNIKIEQSEAALYGGKVRNPKELQDLQDEVASLKKFLGVLEDRQLDAMVLTEELEAALTEVSRQLVSAESDFATRNSTLIAEKDRLERDLERIRAERDAIADAVPEENLRHYEQVRANRRGVAVSTISDDSCSACGAELTPAERQTARSPHQISHCSTCGRILYAG